MKIAFLFPGQGSQFPGMGLDLAQRYPVAKQAFEEADDALGFSISKLCFEGPDEGPGEPLWTGGGQPDGLGSISWIEAVDDAPAPPVALQAARRG